MKKNTIKLTAAIGISLGLFAACAGHDLEKETSQAPETTTREVVETTTQAPTETTTAPATTEAATTEAPEVTTAPAPEPVDYEALKVNELGHIMVVMYHGIKDLPPYQRTAENFVKDLTYMYDHGYRLISMSDYVAGKVDVPAGMTPILLTFDDGLATTFSLVEGEGGYDVNPDSAIGLLEAFAEEHPDFGTDASLYIHGSDWNFRGEGTAKERLSWLVDNGYELGNHSETHANFSKLGAEGLTREIGAVEVYLDSVLPGYELFALTYPFGARPKQNLRDILVTGSYEGHDFDYKIAFREGPSAKFYPSTHMKFTPLAVPRVRGSEGEVQDLWWFLDYYEKHPEMKYISDGDPETIVVPEGAEDNLTEAAKEAFQVIVY